MGKKKIKNVEDLRDNLLEKFETFNEGGMDHKEVNAICNLTGKVLSSAKHQMEYNRTQNNGKTIKFLEGN